MMEAVGQKATLLLRQYQQGERAASQELILLLTPLFFKFFCARSATVSQAEDLTQEFWLKVHTARASYRPTEPALPWLYAIARHTKADSQRRWYSRQQRETVELADAPEPSFDPRPALDSSLFAEAVQAKLRQLPQAQREIFVLLKVQGLSVAEAALASGLSPAAVKQKAFRAYERLRQILRPAIVRAASATVRGSK